MGWRTVVITGRAKLDLKLNSMVVRKEEIARVNIKEIDTLIIESTQVSITTALLSALVKSKVKVIFCDEKHLPQSELHSYYGRYDASLAIRKQILWTNESKSLIWQRIIKDKISKQSLLLKKLEKDEYLLLEKYINEVEINDNTNREGHAAKVYFNALFGLDHCRSDENAINVALNFGYSILLSSFSNEIVKNGYVTQIGIFHNNMFNNFNLASDLMEGFRPFIDRIVFEMKPEIFEHDEKVELLSIFDSHLIINGKSYEFKNAISIFCKSVFSALENNNPELVVFVENEL